ncbi:hypothetical protein CN193_32210 [Sinorhizobium meliloti]|nr:hypothetical protein CN193_32210 [Sinorhizobium meliloti]
MSNKPHTAIQSLKVRKRAGMLIKSLGEHDWQRSQPRVGAVIRRIQLTRDSFGALTDSACVEPVRAS